MKKLKFLALATCLSVGAFAQPKLSKDFTLSKSTPYDVVDAGSKEYFSVGDGMTVSVKTRGEMVTLQKFDSKALKEVKRKVYTDFPKYTKVQEILQVEGHLYYIFEAFDKASRKFSVFSREINVEDLTFGKIQTLLTTDREVVAGLAPVGTVQMFGFGPPLGNKFEVVKSFDGTKILVRYRLKPKSKKDAVNHDELGFYVFDNTMKQLWGKEVEMPYTEKDMNNLAYTVSGDGTAYMLAHINTTKSLELFTVTADKFTTKPLDVKKDLVFQKFDLREDDKGNILCAGFYATGIEFKYGFGGSAFVFNTNGVYYFKFNSQGDVIDAHDYEFTIDFINQYSTEREKDKADKREKEGKAGIPDLVMKEFKVEADGSIVLLGEQVYVRNEFYGPKQQTVWHFADVITTKIARNGDVVWLKKLPKNQAGLRGQGGMGTKYMRGKDAHYVMFLDNVKNANLSMDKAPAPHKDGAGGFLTAYKINDVTGEVEKHSILDVKNLKGTEIHQFNPSRIFDVSEGIFLLETYIKGKKDMMAKIELN